MHVPEEIVRDWSVDPERPVLFVDETRRALYAVHDELVIFTCASLKRQLFFHRERRKMVETDPELTADERVEQLEYHDRLVMRLLGQLIELEGHSGNMKGRAR